MNPPGMFIRADTVATHRKLQRGESKNKSAAGLPSTRQLNFTKLRVVKPRHNFTTSKASRLLPNVSENRASLAGHPTKKLNSQYQNLPLQSSTERCVA